MNFYIVLFALVGALNYCDANTSVAQKYCSMSSCKPGESIACQFTQSTKMHCDGQLLKLDAAAILAEHNKLRNKIASGSLRPQFEPAKKMAEMQWNAELAQMAEYNVRRCEFSHDKCRNIMSFPVSGQNLAIEQQYGNDNWNVNEAIIESINSWFDEYKDANMNNIRKYEGGQGKVIGHFTAMVKDINTHVGCAAARYLEDGWDTVLFACNYASNNILGTVVYEAGPVQSGCKQKSSKYTALCAQ